ncbi:hypothetical protein TTHERM_00430090 (macronuclear) [Tetrahymena thermophila SB210]|uniref:Uncharacterized protein n=1 Tax=Tetrahymena thermophila (strain SB210) TaxID=312017 RepID=Q231F1_TETTS|nr:hypothetical protein TTHERM_00430090 [Tetrahymena thermophila SB210]EAR91088.1 hypothetical protein TTHERM_00430090 [Tetrahymena thermophila SB210]|eukprot:XP_001011333.1 hypothetical protein TTHERM_00430090 [Tetrahymena thermophila SB210]
MQVFANSLFISISALRYFTNKGVTNIKDLYQKCSKNFEKITKQKPKANMFAQYAIKRPKQEIQYQKQQDPRKYPYRKAESAGKSMENNEPIRKNSRNNSKDYYEKLYNLNEGDNQKLIDDVMQMMLVMAEHLQITQEQEENNQNQTPIQQIQNTHNGIPTLQNQVSNNSNSSNNSNNNINNSNNNVNNSSQQFQRDAKKKISIPQIKIIVSSPPKEIQSEPDIMIDDDLKLGDHNFPHQNFQISPLTSFSSNVEEDDDIPDDDYPLSIIESTLYKISAQQYFDVSRISNHIREHIVQL